ncbi:hypothetical protein NLG97_g4235 [Lecanicillium saksenae]|uniref:Uncharacterized protein n=1 Tax=Lecanicillium saksenae TaxID=468837 RepID=A0ACC1QXL1_9HYPO|nr:hypothetical protein NLG97_g4235 [Lecanicillium saksenae]
MSDTSYSSGKPRTRQRAYKAPPQLDVPDIEEDAAERKRVLNVLAQRRYREKKRQRRQKQQAQGKTNDETNEFSPMEECAVGEQSSSGNNIVDEFGVDCIEEIEQVGDAWPAMTNMSLAPLLLNSSIESNIPQNDSEWVDFSSSMPSSGGIPSLDFFTSSG